ISALVDRGYQATERPEFSTQVMPAKDRCVIVAQHPSQVALTEYDPRKFGLIQYECCKDVLAFFQATDDVEAIKQGGWSSLFRADGSFYADSMEKPIIPPESTPPFSKTAEAHRQTGRQNIPQR